MAEVIGRTGAELGVVAVPADAAQEVADALVAAGIRGILNFAPTVLRLPPGVSLVAVDLAVQLEQLAFLVHLTRMQQRPTAVTSPRVEARRSHALPGSVTVAQEILVLFVQVRILAG